jgi:hypothetical protein
MSGIEAVHWKDAKSCTGGSHSQGMPCGARGEFPGNCLKRGSEVMTR